MDELSVSPEFTLLQQSLDAMQKDLLSACAAREEDYRTRLALAVQCKTLREALKEALSELEAISYARYKGLEAKCLAAMEMSAKPAEEIIAEYESALQAKRSAS